MHRCLSRGRSSPAKRGRGTAEGGGGAGPGAALRTPTTDLRSGAPPPPRFAWSPSPASRVRIRAAPPPRWCRGRFAGSPRSTPPRQARAAPGFLARRARRRGASRGRLGWDFLRGAVDLDREAERGTVEVEHVRPDRMLAPEAQAPDLSAAHGLPEQNLRQCHGAPQRACALEGEKRRSHAAKPNPHPRSGGGGPPKAVEGARLGAALRTRPPICAPARPLHHASHGPPPRRFATEEDCERAHIPT